MSPIRRLSNHLPLFLLFTFFIPSLSLKVFLKDLSSILLINFSVLSFNAFISSEASPIFFLLSFSLCFFKYSCKLKNAFAVISACSKLSFLSFFFSFIVFSFIVPSIPSLMISFLVTNSIVPFTSLILSIAPALFIISFINAVTGILANFSFTISYSSANIFSYNLSLIKTSSVTFGVITI